MKHSGWRGWCSLAAALACQACGSEGGGAEPRGPSAAPDAGQGDAGVDAGGFIGCDVAEGIPCPPNDPNPVGRYETPEGKGRPPPPPSEPHPAEGAPPAVFAVQKVFLGETDRQGNPSPDAWKSYGFDLDGWSSDVGFGLHCRPISSGDKRDIRVDGKDGIDNSFGRNITTIFQTFTMSPSDELSATIAAGRGTLLLSLDALSESPEQTGLSAAIFPALGAPAPHGSIAPTEAQWASGSYAWRPLARAGASALVHPSESSYVTGDVLVVTSSSPLWLALPWVLPFRIEIHGLILSGKLSPDRRRITEGTLGGIIPTASMSKELDHQLGRVSPSLCDPSAREGLINQVEAASDSLLDGTQDPKRSCDGISIGVGFEAGAALLGDEAPSPMAPGGDPCSESSGEPGF